MYVKIVSLFCEGLVPVEGIVSEIVVEITIIVEFVFEIITGIVVPIS
jgi:hypothetical protein